MRESVGVNVEQTEGQQQHKLGSQPTTADENTERTRGNCIGMWQKHKRPKHRNQINNRITYSAYVECFGSGKRSMKLIVCVSVCLGARFWKNILAVL